MSNHRTIFSSLIVLGALGAAPARGQSADLLDAVRMARPGIAGQAWAELEPCLRRRCAQAASLRLLTGMLLLSDGEPRGAATLLAAGPAPAGLEPFRRWYQGEAEAWSGQRRRALATLAGAAQGAPPWLRQRIELRRAELQLDLGQASAARPVLERLAAGEPGPELLLDRALARLATGEVPLGRRDLRALALRFPNHPHAALALARLGDPAWTDEERVQRSRTQLAGGDPTGALASLEHVAEASPRALLARGLALLQLRREDEGLRALEAAAGSSVAETASEARMALARRLLRLDRTEEARLAFLEVEAGWPREPAADEAGYLGAWLAMNQGRLEEAIAAFEAFEARHPESRRRDEARWFRSLSLLRAERPLDARAALDSLVEDFPRSPLVPQALYWSARLRPLPDAGAAPVSDAYRALVAGFPGSLAARLALEQLRARGEPMPEPFPRLEESRPAPLPPELTLASRLAACGLLPDAHQAVEAAVAQVQGPPEALRLGAGLLRLGEYAAAQGLAGRHLWAAAFTAREPAALALLYPRAWRESVERWGRVHGAEPALAWAIMRRESSFHPEATSGADARGLMQLLPGTARQLAEDARAAPPDPEELYLPETNIRFGTSYLGRLLHRFEHPALVAAAYNGGPTPVLRWLRERGGQPLDRWIEEIPYRETRAYVKQVLADLFIYRALYGGSGAPLPLALPVPAASGIGY